MVKNVKGGSGHKGQARKYTTTNNNSNSNNTRLALEEGELYAQVTKNMGNGMCHVICQDEKIRLCFIRGKFRGRGKRDNTISMGKWVLIGTREYESERKDKLENCDLLEVYQDQDKSKLISRVPTMNWTKFLVNDNANANSSGGEGVGGVGGVGVTFIDERQEEYLKLMKSIEEGPAQRAAVVLMKEQEQEQEQVEIDFNDI
jgi:initiation factor 1A